jgi:hypothetical protein
MQQPKRAQYFTHFPLPLYSRFPAALASILLLAVLAIRISCRVIALFVFRKPLFIK